MPRTCAHWVWSPESHMSAPDYSRDEMMTVTAARQLRNHAVCFVGIGLPSAACNLARLTHAPDLVLIYESGTVGTRPVVLPLSIGDGELAETATCLVPLPEIFAHYLQRARVDLRFLGAPEISTYAREVLIVMQQSPRSFVPRLDFHTSCGYLEGSGARRASGCPGAGPRAVITDFGVLRPHRETEELQLAALYPGVTAEAARAACGWPLQLAARLETLPAPSPVELESLRDLE